MTGVEPFAVATRIPESFQRVLRPDMIISDDRAAAAGASEISDKIHENINEISG